MKKTDANVNSIPKAKAKRKKDKARPKRTPRTRKPVDMSLEEWQIALRREFGREQILTLENIGDEPFFSEFLVTNPKTKGTYRVAIRGKNPGDNYCSCPDFAVNTLGTCKHIEFTLAKLERKRGGKKAFREGFHSSYSEVYLRYGVKREVRFLPGTECPEELLQHASRFFGADGALRPSAYSHFDRFMKNAPRNGHELRCYEDAVQFVAQVRDDTERQKKIGKRFPQDFSGECLRDLLKVGLYPYQYKGALFAANAGRCLIADDMGLGKTIQAIAAVEILARTVGVSRVLVIAPTSLKHQWKQEIDRFSGRTTEVIEGLLARRQELYQTDAFYKIVNYEVIHRDLRFIEEWAPDVIILDEAQ
ncbi:MAG: SNF2-related protein, partial [bacterium]